MKPTRPASAGRGQWGKKRAPVLAPTVEPKVIVLVDWENIARTAFENGRKVDLKQLATLCRTFGEVVYKILFVPDHEVGKMSQSEYDWRERATEEGFVIVATRSRFSSNNIDNNKQYRNADTSMIDFGNRSLSLVDKLVLVSNDADLITLVNHTKDQGKEVVVIGGDELSQILYRGADAVYSLPK
jgi:uncharacterized LabA/DUF88 family protein